MILSHKILRPVLLGDSVLCWLWWNKCPYWDGSCIKKLKVASSQQPARSGAHQSISLQGSDSCQYHVSLRVNPALVKHQAFGWEPSPGWHLNCSLADSWLPEALPRLLINGAVRWQMCVTTKFVVSCYAAIDNKYKGSTNKNTHNIIMTIIIVSKSNNWFYANGPVRKDIIVHLYKTWGQDWDSRWHRR